MWNWNRNNWLFFTILFCGNIFRSTNFEECLREHKEYCRRQIQSNIVSLWCSWLISCCFYSNPFVFFREQQTYNRVERSQVRLFYQISCKFCNVSACILHEFSIVHFVWQRGDTNEWARKNCSFYSCCRALNFRDMLHSMTQCHQDNRSGEHRIGMEKDMRVAFIQFVKTVLTWIRWTR